jgi:SAM-dependent methyltransferase
MPRADTPRYRTWIRTTRLAVFAALSCVLLAAGAVLSLLSPWFLLLLVPCALFCYIATILALTVYRLSPRGGDLQRRIHDLIVARAAPPPGSHVLDVGCGSGSLAVKLAQASPTSTVTGVDSWGRDWEYSKDLCARNARIEGVADRTSFLQRSAAGLGFAEDEFDVVVSCMTFHEVAELSRKTDAVTEALRVLRPGGRYVFLDLFADPAAYPSRDAVRAAVAATGASTAEFTALSDLVPLPFPLRHPKVLGHAVLIAGAMPG